MRTAIRWYRGLWIANGDGWHANAVPPPLMPPEAIGSAAYLVVRGEGDPVPPQPLELTIRDAPVTFGRALMLSHITIARRTRPLDVRRALVAADAWRSTFRVPALVLYARGNNWRQVAAAQNWWISGTRGNVNRYASPTTTPQALGMSSRAAAARLQLSEAEAMRAQFP